MNLRPAIFIFTLLARAASLPALDLWRHPEIAGKNSVLADVGLAPFVFKSMEFPVLPLELRVDYLPPLPLPVSFGLFMKTPNPNLKSFGSRIAWHFGLGDALTDLFFAHVFDFGFVRNALLEEYGDSPAEIHYYDFRIGVRRFFGPYVGAALESDFKAGGVIFMISAKIH
jgi:hypothetical protein